MLVETVLFEWGLKNRCAAKRAVSETMVEHKEHCREAWVAAGFAVEFAIKALIVRQRGWNCWPSAQSNPELHVHTLNKLLREAGIDFKAAPRSVKPSLRQVLDWERRHDYIATTMPRKVARSMVEAAFGDEGVVQWLNSL